MHVSQEIDRQRRLADASLVFGIVQGLSEKGMGLLAFPLFHQFISQIQIVIDFRIVIGIVICHHFVPSRESIRTGAPGPDAAPQLEFEPDRKPGPERPLE